MARPQIPIDEAYLIAGWLESLLWGFYTLLFSACLHAIYTKRRKLEGIRKCMSALLAVLYILATAHMLLALIRLVQGFVLLRDTIGPVAYFSSTSLHTNMAKDYIYITSLAVCDIFLVRRMYVVWAGNVWIVTLPLLMTIGEFVAGYGAIAQRLMPDPVSMTVAPWGTATFAISMATNIIITATLALRVWYVTARAREIMGTQCSNRAHSVIVAIIESAVSLAVAKVVEFILFMLGPANGFEGSNGMYIVYEIMPQLSGLVPTCIVYMVANGLSHQDDFYFAACIALNARGGRPPDPSAISSASLSTVAFSGNDEWPPKRIRRSTSGGETTACGEHSQDGFEMARVKKADYSARSDSSIMEISVV